MKQAGRKEGLRAPLFYVCAALLFAAACAGAQQVSQSDLESCARLASPDERLACFEALTERNRSQAAAVLSATAVVEPAAAGLETTPSTDVTPDNEPATAAADEVAAGTNAVADLPEPIEAEGAVTTEPAASSGGLPEEAGEEYLPQEREEPEVFIETVTEVEQGRNRVLYFHMQNGQVWRQMEPRRLPYPRGRPFEVEIKRGTMGDYQLRVEGEGRMTRIVRVE